MMKLLTYNAAMLPDPVGTDKEIRAKEIVEVILNSDIDFVCLQEIFSEPARQILDKGLANDFPYRKIKSDDNDFLNEDSGLFFASKFPFCRNNNHDICRFEEFNDNQFLTSDSVSDKGIFGAKLDINGKKKNHTLYIFNTHLQSTEAYWEVRQKQLSQIIKFIYKSLKNSDNLKRTSCLLSGDFNVIGDVTRQVNEYQLMMNQLICARDLFRETLDLEHFPGFTWDGKNNKFIKKTAPRDKDQQRLDYIFGFDEIPVKDDNANYETYLAPVKVDDIAVIPLQSENYKKVEDLSDHYGVLLTFDV